MTRYVLTHRRAGKVSEAQRRSARDKVHGVLGAIEGIARIAHDHAPANPSARRIVVFDADAHDVQRRLLKLHRDVLLEPEIKHHYDSSSSVSSRRPKAHRANSPRQRLLRVQVRGRGRPVREAQVVLMLRDARGKVRQQPEVTAASGDATFRFDASLTPVALAVVPRAGFWTMVLQDPQGDAVRIDVPPLPKAGPMGWWHTALGVSRNHTSRGRGIRVGVADTGVGPHPCLAHVEDIGSFTASGSDPDGGADSAAHGTHVCGIIGARPKQPGQYAGIAPGACLISARVFAREGSANQADIAHGIDVLSNDHRADLINLSLGATERSRILHDVIRDAFDRGTLCVCAAANSETPGPVEWPGAFPETIAVSAIGLLGWGPPGSIANFRVPKDAAKHGRKDYFLANNSCFGKNLGCAGPGVGIISTVPRRAGQPSPFGEMTGTSMASPAVCGALAALLAEDDTYLRLPRDRSRATKARHVLEQACSDIGLARRFEGNGLPMLK